MTPQEFGQKVYKLRMAKGWTQEKCCLRAGISVRTLQVIEEHAMKSPSVATVRKLARAFKCDWPDLIGKP
jgi:transcriptional regulator with XRE-family HTH domain